MSKTEKRFDSVAMMQSIRDKISAEIKGMTLEEEHPAARLIVVQPDLVFVFSECGLDRPAHLADAQQFHLVDIDRA